METTLLENEDSQEQPQPETEVKEVEQSDETQPEEGTEKSSEETKEVEGVKAEEAPPEEKTFEVDGQPITASRIRELQKNYDNDQKWSAKNTQRAQELAELEKQRQQEIFLGQKLLSRQDLIQQVLQTPKERDLQEELKTHYAQRPQDPFSQEYADWEVQKDMALAEIARKMGAQDSEARLTQIKAEEHNTRISLAAIEKYKPLTDESEFRKMSQWILENLKANNGAYPEKAYDIAFKELYSDKEVENTRKDAVAKVNRSIDKAKPNLPGNGLPDKQETSVDDLEDEAFIQEMKQIK